jgi:hypothetical protein
MAYLDLNPIRVKIDTTSVSNNVFTLSSKASNLGVGNHRLNMLKGSGHMLQQFKQHPSLKLTAQPVLNDVS